MTALTNPLVLMAAALVCAAMGLRARRPMAPDGVAPGAPGWMLLLARPPWPAPIVARTSRASDASRLVRAGVSAAIGPPGVARARASAIAVGVAIAAAAAPVSGTGAVVLVPALALAGAIAPSRWLARRAAGRRRSLVRELPDLLDLLGICVEAGMALDPSLRVAADRIGGTLGLEVARLLEDLRLGMPRGSAYRALVERAGCPEVAQTVAALLQSEELGAPLSRALQGQAEAMRVARRQAARERAAQAAPKIQLVVALLMVPAVLLLVIGILIVELSRQVGAVVGVG